MGTFVEQDETIAAPRALLTARAVGWAAAQLRAEHASISGLARQLGVDWNTMWRALKTRLECLDTDPGRFDGVRMLGVDETAWVGVQALQAVSTASGCSASTNTSGTTSISACADRRCSPGWSI